MQILQNYIPCLLLNPKFGLNLLLFSLISQTGNLISKNVRSTGRTGLLNLEDEFGLERMLNGDHAFRTKEVGD